MAFEKVQSRSPFFRAFTNESLIVVEYVGQTDVAALDELMRLQQTVIAKYGSFSMLQFASSDGAGKLDEGVRKKGAEMLKASEKQNRGNALVIRGNSLGAMLLRTVVTGINALSRSTVPSKTFSTAAEALSWLQSVPGQHAGVKSVTVAQIEPLVAPQSKAA